MGWSVFQGDTPDSFTVEILGVMPNPTPGGELVIARLTGQNLEASGVVAGMSGSPVYVDGKLLGAVAYGWPFSKEAIAGITPIHRMLAIPDRPGGAPGTYTGDPEVWDALWSASGAEALSLMALRDPSRGADTWSAIQMPLALAGFTPEALDLARACFSGTGLLPVAGSAADPGGPQAELRPGGAVAVDLVRGDAQVSGIGTVTWVGDSRVLALGHPMLGHGSVRLPMSGATVITVLPSTFRSFKMGAVGSVVGAVTHDYQPGVAGELGAQAPVIPVQVQLNLPAGPRKLSFEVAHSEMLTPVLMAMVTANSLSSFDRGAGRTTMRVTTQARLSTGQELNLTNILAGAFPAQEAAGEVVRALGLLYRNPWEPVALESLSLQVDVLDDVPTAELERVEIRPGRLRPGDSVEVRAFLRDYRGRVHEERARLRLPDTAPPGSYRVVVCAGPDARRAQRERSPASLQPRSVSQLVAILEQEHPHDTLLFELARSSSHPVVEGHELPDLPGSWERVLDSSQIAGRKEEARATVVDRSLHRLGQWAAGCRTLDVRVEGD